MVSEVHGNFIVNLGGATSDDVLRLIDRGGSKWKPFRRPASARSGVDRYVT